MRVGPYEVLEELGRGGMGVVYRARRAEAPDREVALKVLPAPLADADERMRFQREAQALSAFQHYGVVEVLDAGWTAERYPYLALELVRGGTLFDRLKRSGALDPDEAVEITIALAEAVGAAHAAGVLHRDLKPANVLFTETGAPVLADFGLAKLTRRAERITVTGEVLGTPGYMAPEQARGEAAQVASDVYGLGATLYAMLSGRPPFQGGSAMAVLSKLVSEEPAPLPAEVDAGLRAICLRCLAKDPAERYPDCESLGEALRTWQVRGSGGARFPAALATLGLLLIGAVGAVGVASMASGPDASVSTAGSAALPPAPSPAPLSPAPSSGPSPAPPSSAPSSAPPSPAPPSPAPPRSNPDARRLLREAQAAEAAGRTRSALRKRRAAWRLDPDAFDTPLRRAFAKVLYARGLFREALQVIDRSIHFDGGDMEARMGRTMVLRALCRRADAIQYLNAMLRVAPAGSPLAREGDQKLRQFREEQAEVARRRTPSPRVDALVREAEEAMRKGDWERGLEACTRASHVRPAPRVMLLAGRCFLKLERFKDALTAALNALTFAPTPQAGAEAAYLIAQIAVAKGDSSGALRFLNHAVDLDGAHADALALRAGLRFDLGEYEDAFDDGRRALDAQPQSYLGLLLAAWKTFHAGDYEAALARFDAILERGRGRQLPAREGRAAALTELGRSREAEAVLDGLLKLQPKRPRARFLRAELRWARGARREAFLDQQQGLAALSPEFADRERLEARLEEMRAAQKRR